MKTRSRVALAAALVSVSTGCVHAPIWGGGAYDGSNVREARPGAIRYYLAKDVIEVQAEVTLRRETTVIARKDGAGRYRFELWVRMGLLWSRATLTPRTVADTAAFFQVELAPRLTSADALRVEIGEDGRLRAVNAESASQLGEALSQGIEVAAAAATGVAGMLAGAPPELTSQVQGLFEGEAAEAPGLEASLRASSVETLYLLAEDPEARAIWARRLRAEAAHRRREVGLQELEDRLSAPDQEAVGGERLSQVDAMVKRAVAEREAMSAALAARRAELWKARRLGAEERTERLKMVLELADIPPPGALSEGLRPSEVRQRLLHHPRMARLYEEARVAFTLEMPALPEGDPNAVAAPPRPGHGTSEEGRLYYRQSYPGVMRVYAGVVRPPREAVGQRPPAAWMDEEQIGLVEEQVMDLVPAHGPRLYVTFTARDFSERKLSLSFDEKGRLRTFERSGSAALTGAARALGPAVRETIKRGVESRE